MSKERHSCTVFLLQSPRLELDQAMPIIRLKRAWALLYYLLVHKSASREELTGLIWSEESSDLARRHLRDILYHLKKSCVAELIVSNGRNTLQLNQDVIFQIDYDQFLEGDTGAYQGEFLKGFYLDGASEYEMWVSQMRETLRETYLRRLLEQGQTAFRQGLLAQAEWSWRNYLKEEPMSEPVTAALMELYRQKKDFNRAAMAYRALHSTLEHCLGITPLKETSDLYYTIMNEWNSAAGNPQAGDGDLLIGRWEQFRQMSRPFRSGSSAPCSIVVMGEAGVGKSHLLNYFIRRADLHDWTVITSSCFKSRQDEALHPWQAVMFSLHALIEQEKLEIPDALFHMVSPLFPVFAQAEDFPFLRPHISLDSGASYEGTLLILSAVAVRKRLLLVFEDIQWMDPASTLLLDMLIHRLPSDRLLFAAACREPAAPRISTFLDLAQEDGLLRRYELQPFTSEETIQFIDSSGAETFSSELKGRIYRDTQGNAFLLTQLLGSLLEHGQPEQMPNNAREIMAYRLSGLSREGQKILDMIAMFPDYAPYEVLERMSSKSPLDLLYICQELRGRSIISEVTDGGNLSFVFAQPELRELVYSRILPLSRHILHLNIAKELVRSSSAKTLYTLSQIIYHYRQGGDAFQALRFQILQFKTQTLPISTLCFPDKPVAEFSAGSKPQVLELIYGMQQELERLKEIDPSTEHIGEMEFDLLYAKACYCVFKGNYRMGLEAINLLLKRELDSKCRDLIYEQMIFYSIQIYDTTLMRRCVQKALELTRDQDPQRYAVNRRYYGFLLVMEGEFSQGRKELRNSLALMEEAFPEGPEYAVQAAYAHNYIGEAYRKEGLFSKAVEEYQTTLEITLKYGASTSMSVFHTNLAVTMFAMERYSEAKALLKKAEDYFSYIEEPSGYRTVASAYLALYDFAEGRDAQTCQHLIRAEKLANMLSGPYDLGVVTMMKAVLRSWCDAQGGRPELDRLLDRPCEEYVRDSRRLLKGKSALAERMLLETLSKKEPVLEMFLAQVTEK